jgi:hypothetical protein
MIWTMNVLYDRYDTWNEVKSEYVCEVNSAVANSSSRRFLC